MLTVAEAARRTGRSPETIRMWIRSGQLRARKVGGQHVIEPEALDELRGPYTLPVPDGWTRTFWGGPMPDTVAAIRRGHMGH